MRNNQLPIINSIMKNKKLEESDFRVHFTLYDVSWNSSDVALKDELVERIGTDCRVHLVQISNQVSQNEYDVTVGLYNDVQAFQYLTSIQKAGNGILVAISDNSCSTKVYTPVISRVFRSFMNRLELAAEQQKNKQEAEDKMGEKQRDIQKQLLAKQQEVEKQQNINLQMMMMLATGSSNSIGSFPLSKFAQFPMQDPPSDDQYPNPNPKTSAKTPSQPTSSITVDVNLNKTSLINLSHRRSLSSIASENPHSEQPEEYFYRLWAFGVPSQFQLIDVYRSLTDTTNKSDKKRWLKLVGEDWEQEQARIKNAIKIGKCFNMEYFEILLKEGVSKNTIYNKLAPKVENHPYILIPALTATPHTHEQSLLRDGIGQNQEAEQTEVKVSRMKLLEELSRYSVEVAIKDDYDDEKKIINMIDELGGVNMMFRFEVNREEQFIRYAVMFNTVVNAEKLMAPAAAAWISKELQDKDEREHGSSSNVTIVVTRKPYPMLHVGRVLTCFTFQSLMLEMSSYKHRHF